MSRSISRIAMQIDNEYRRKKYLKNKYQSICNKSTCNKCNYKDICEMYEE